MLIGPVCGSLCARFVIQASSFHLVVRTENDGRGRRWHFGRVRERVGLEATDTVVPEDVELVASAVADLGNEDPRCPLIQVTAWAWPCRPSS